jgi:hypothetical protein
MRDFQSVCGVLLAAASLSAACISPSHHVRYMDRRHSERGEACVAESLQAYADRGPSRPRLAFAVVTAECSDSKEPQCREQLLQGGCEVNADALIDVSQRVSQGRLRMVGTAVEFTGEEGEEASSGGSAEAPATTPATPAAPPAATDHRAGTHTPTTPRR